MSSWKTSLTRFSLCGVLLGACLWSGPLRAAPRGDAPTLSIYFIDVEGGQSTLIVTPDRHALLVDAGWAGVGEGYIPGDPRQARDAHRIVAAAQDAGISAIDALWITHFHVDHVGGVGELARLMPIRAFIDHGAPAAELLATDFETRNAFTVYRSLRNGARHVQARAGDRVPLAWLDATVVSSDARVLPTPLAGGGAANPRCSGPAVPTQDPLENPRSSGFVLRFGRFRFLDLGDLSGEPLRRLVCPRSLTGPVDVYLVSHHGGGDAGSPAVFSGFAPRVVILNNGVRKGGARETFETLHRLEPAPDVWQLHRSDRAGERNFAASAIANLDETTAHWIKVSARRDGSFEVLNGRSGAARRYAAVPLPRAEK